MLTWKNIKNTITQMPAINRVLILVALVCASLIAGHNPIAGVLLIALAFYALAFEMLVLFVHQESAKLSRAISLLNQYHAALSKAKQENNDGS